MTVIKFKKPEKLRDDVGSFGMLLQRVKAWNSYPSLEWLGQAFESGLLALKDVLPVEQLNNLSFGFTSFSNGDVRLIATLPNFAYDPHYFPYSEIPIMTITINSNFTNLTSDALVQDEPLHLFDYGQYVDKLAACVYSFNAELMGTSIYLECKFADMFYAFLARMPEVYPFCLWDYNLIPKTNPSFWFLNANVMVQVTLHMDVLSMYGELAYKELMEYKHDQH